MPCWVWPINEMWTIRENRHFFAVRDILTKKGALLNVYDNWVTSENTVPSFDDCIDKVKAIVIVTEHSDVIEKLINTDLTKTDVEIVIDGRNCLDGDTIKKQNVLYRGIGRRV